jgi:hypothetical protein
MATPPATHPASYCPDAAHTLQWGVRPGSTTQGWILTRNDDGSSVVAVLDGYPHGRTPVLAGEACEWADRILGAAQEWVEQPARSGAYHRHNSVVAAPGAALNSTPDPQTAEPDDPAAYALARHIADHPVSTIQAAFRYLNTPITIELEPAAVPPADRAGLRELIAGALYRHEWPGKQVWEQALAMDREAFLAQADAVLPVLPETARLHDEILTLRADQAKMRDLLRSENERANSAIDRETTAEEAEEEHRLALSEALGLGTGAPWDAIRVRAAELAGQGLVEDDEGDELVCIDECGLCDACGMEPFGTPAEGWREAARFLRRTARDSGNREGALHGARLIETELRRLADEAPQPETQAAPDTASLAKVVRWVTSEVVVTKTEFGNGYRAAQRDIRDLMNGPSRLAAVAEPGKESVWCSAVALRVHHAPHDWEPQPGMTPVHCGGHPAPAVTLPGKEA